MPVNISRSGTPHISRGAASSAVVPVRGQRGPDGPQGPAGTGDTTALNTLTTSGRLGTAAMAASFTGCDAVIIRAAGVYPLRSTATADAARRVRWVGAVSPTIGSGYATAGLDVWEQTS